MLYYATLGTNNLPRARAFYGPTLATLGIVDLRPKADEAGYGPPGDSDPRLYIVAPYDGQPATQGNGTMLALAAPNRAAVRAFYDAALANGGTEEGAPGLRYSENFYACYVRDLDGNKLSAVCNLPE